MNHKKQLQKQRREKAAHRHERPVRKFLGGRVEKTSLAASFFFEVTRGYVESMRIER